MVATLHYKFPKDSIFLNKKGVFNFHKTNKGTTVLYEEVDQKDISSYKTLNPFNAEIVIDNYDTEGTINITKDNPDAYESILKLALQPDSWVYTYDKFKKLDDEKKKLEQYGNNLSNK